MQYLFRFPFIIAVILYFIVYFALPSNLSKMEMIEDILKLCLSIIAILFPAYLTIVVLYITFTEAKLKILAKFGNSMAKEVLGRIKIQARIIGCSSSIAILWMSSFYVYIRIHRETSAEFLCGNYVIIIPICLSIISFLEIVWSVLNMIDMSFYINEENVNELIEIRKQSAR